jgi:hypothetical protein
MLVRAIELAPIGMKKGLEPSLPHRVLPLCLGFLDMSIVIDL